jgi:hypothetical protein
LVVSHPVRLSPRALVDVERQQETGSNDKGLDPFYVPLLN